MKVAHTYVDKHSMIWKENLYVQYLSLVLAKKHYGNITFYGDETACEQIRELELPYDEINDSVVKKDDADTWSVPKIKVYESMKEPFLHIDTDTLLFSKIELDTYQQDFLFSHIDMFTPEGNKKDELMKELYQYYFCNIPKVNEEKNKKTTFMITMDADENVKDVVKREHYDVNYPFRSFVGEQHSQIPSIVLQGLSNLDEFFYMNKTYSKLFFDLMENINKTIFDNTHFQSIPNMNIVYVKNPEVFSKVCEETLKHYDKNKEKIDKEEFGSCYIEQLMLHAHLRMLDKTYKKSNNKNNHVIFDDNPSIQIDPHNNIAEVDKVQFPFRLRILNQTHLSCSCCDEKMITKLSKFNNFYNVPMDQKFKEISIESVEDISNFFEEDFNGFLHVSYLKWYDIIQAIVIDKLRKLVGDDEIRKINSYYAKRYKKMNLPAISGGEKLYTKLTGFKFNEVKDIL